MIMRKIKSEVLYYPTIEFYDDSWLKGALCLWEKVYRITPNNYIPRDSDDVKRAIDAGLVESIKVTKGDAEFTAHKFMEFWSDAIITPAGFSSDDNAARLHLDKVDERIREKLASISQGISHDGFIKLNPRTANTYMLFLADRMARNMSIPKITDDSDMFTAIQYFEHSGNFDGEVYCEDRDEVIASLALGSLIPSDIDTYPMESVIDFRKRTEEGRAAFRGSVADLLLELRGIHDKAYFARRIAKFDADLSRLKKPIAEALKADARDIGYALFSVGLPTTLTAFGALAIGSDPWTWNDLGSSAFIGFISTLADHQRARRKNWTPQDASYWLSLKSAFSDGKKVSYKLPEFHRSFEEFMND